MTRARQLANAIRSHDPRETMMPATDRIHDEFCRCRACKPGPVMMVLPRRRPPLWERLVIPAMFLAGIGGWGFIVALIWKFSLS